MSVLVYLLHAHLVGVEVPVNLLVMAVLVVVLDVLVFVEPVCVLVDLVAVAVLVTVHLLLSRWLVGHVLLLHQGLRHRGPGHAHDPTRARRATLPRPTAGSPLSTL